MAQKVTTNNAGIAVTNNKTDRIEFTPFQRGIIVYLSRNGRSQNSLALEFNASQGGISRLIQRTTERQRDTGLAWDDIELYQTAPGRGREPALSTVQKEYPPEEQTSDHC